MSNSRKSPLSEIIENYATTIRIISRANRRPSENFNMFKIKGKWPWKSDNMSRAKIVPSSVIDKKTSPIKLRNKIAERRSFINNKETRKWAIIFVVFMIVKFAGHN